VPFLKDSAALRAFLTVSFAFLLLIACTSAQTTAQTHVNPADAKEGASLFRANCSPCHGPGARGGGRGPDLTSGRWTHGSTDDEIFRTITQGAPGTEMPANAFDDAEVWSIIAYLRSLAPPKNEPLPGNPANGKKLFSGRAACSTCHMVSGSGGVLGPDLSRVGAARSAKYLVESIRDPDKELSAGMVDPNNHYGLPLVYDKVTVVLSDGKKVVGVARNEDTYSVQLMGTDQKLHFFLKKAVKVSHEHASLMPPYTPDALPQTDLEDIVAYLSTLRGGDAR
jgi:cytochrome c oxidase cbb3-type subunit III